MLLSFTSSLPEKLFALQIRNLHVKEIIGGNMKLLFRETAPTMTWHFSEKVFLHPLIKSLSLLCQGGPEGKVKR
jgi:hypothetical protein